MTVPKAPVIGAIKSWANVKSALENIRNYLIGLGTLKGDTGPEGARGPLGPGVAAAGSTHQLLQKKSATDYDTEWTSKVDITGDVIVDNELKGLVLKSPNGHYWRETIGDAGAVTWADLGTSKP